MAEFNADAKTTPKGTMRTELWYAKSGDGAEKEANLHGTGNSEARKRAGADYLYGA